MSEPSAFDGLWEESRESLTWMSPYKGNRMVWNAALKEAAKRIRTRWADARLATARYEESLRIVESLLEEGE